MKRPRWQNERKARPLGGWLRRPRALRAGVWLAALTLGVLAGALRGEQLLARAFPERAANVRLAVIGNAHASAEELAAAAGVAPGTPLASLDLVAVEAALAGHPWVRRARVAALPPDQLILAVEEREPVAVARLSGIARLVDRDGTAFAPAGEDTRLPELRGAGAPGGPPLLEGVALLAAVEAQGLPAPHALILTADEPATVPALELASDAPAPSARVLIGRDDQAAKLARLAELLRANLPELGSAAEIDLRFGEDVVLRPKPEAGGENEATPRVADSAGKSGKSS
jgi:cell division protein FtsQ